MRHRTMLLRRLLAGAGLAAMASLAGGGLLAEEAKLHPSPPTAVEISRWVRELDADSYATREAATSTLIAAGPAAVELLAPAILSDSAEVSGRASLILEQISQRGDEATVGLVFGSLQKLASKRPAVAKMIAQIKTQQATFRHTRAVAKVRALGGNLTGNLDGVASGEVAMAMPAVFIEDPFAEVELAAPADIPIAVPDEGPAIGEAEAVPPPRGIIGLLGRLFAPAAEPVDLPPVEFVPELAPSLVPPDADPLPPVKEAPAVTAADDIPLFDDAPELPAAPEPPPPEVGGAAVEEAVEIVVADELAMEGFMIGAPVMVGVDFVDGGEEAYAELTLDKNFRGSDSDLALLADIPEIYSLSINGAKLSDNGLIHIAALPRLTTLTVRETQFSSAALRKLRQQKPELSIICRSAGMLGINAGLEGSCVITSVFFKSGAYEAGLKDRDEIIEVDGQKIRDFSDLTIAVYSHKPGDKLTLKYRRNGAENEVSVTLKSRSAIEE